MDDLYGELDELTAASMRRHAEGCARCAGLHDGLRATMQIAVLPLEEPSPELEERLLAAADRAARPVPIHRRLLRALSWAGSHAMRPQLAMAALLMLVLGSSLLLLRARGGGVGVTPVSVSERGEPNAPVREARTGADTPAASAAPAPAATSLAADKRLESRDEDKPLAAASASAAGPPDEVFNRGLANYRAGNHQVAQQDFAEAERAGGPNAANAALYQARAVRSQAGCGAAVPYYTAVRDRYGASPASADATWEQAACQNAIGDVGEARRLWLALRNNDDYRKRADQELAANAPPATATTGGGAAGGKASPAAPAAPVAAPPATGASQQGAHARDAYEPSQSF
ncbi:MAG: zf-HC2 domain-containing protein [Myxococcales bacterium]|nr:zf-HC2 domain-containing protein [Myxococcales bacterium]